MLTSLIVRAAFIFVLLLSCSGCASVRSHQSNSASEFTASTTFSELDKDTQALASELAALGSGVQQKEAKSVAIEAYQYSRQLAREYGAVWPASFHNFLVNSGFKKRGLCYQWAEDLWKKLEALDLKTLQLNWGMARAGTYREHNCVVMTASGQPFETGVILDPWRRSGRLVWKRVKEDRYPWVKGELIPTGDPSTSIPQPIQ